MRIVQICLTIPIFRNSQARLPLTGDRAATERPRRAARAQSTPSWWGNVGFLAHRLHMQIPCQKKNIFLWIFPVEVADISVMIRASHGDQSDENG